MSSEPLRPLPTAAWWKQGTALTRVVTDLLAAELAQMRPSRPPAPPPWRGDLYFVGDLGVDSLELMGMGTALAEALHLQRDRVDERLLARPCLDQWVDSARAGLASNPVPAAAALTFRTSGSAGSPKRCTHALATLAQEVDALAALVPGRRRILSAVPSHHIYGFLFTVLLPQRLGIEEVVDLRTAGPAGALGMVRAGDLIVAHPGWWEALARLGPDFGPDFGPDVVGVTSTAPCPDPLADALARAGLRLLQVYGSSETGGVGWRAAGATPYTLLPYWSRAGDDTHLTRTMPDGGVQAFPLQDRLEWDDAGRFRPAGRVDQAVQVGGINVFTAYVADVLAMHPDVAAASVRLMRPDEGTRLKAFVVARPGADVAALHAALPDWAAARLSTPERPVAYTFGTRLPRQASGKPADWIIDAE